MPWSTKRPGYFLIRLWFVFQKRFYFSPQIFDMSLVLNLLSFLEIDFSQVFVFFGFPFFKLLFKFPLNFFLFVNQLLVLLLELLVSLMLFLESLTQIIIFSFKFFVIVQLTGIIFNHPGQLFVLFNHNFQLNLELVYLHVFYCFFNLVILVLQL